MSGKRDMQIADMVGKPISEKMDQVAEAVCRDGEQTRAEYKRQIGGIKKVVDEMRDDLSAREKKELYDLNTLIDVAKLDDTEKRFLVEALYTLAGMCEQITDAQQAFIRSVQKYLDIKNVQTMVDLSSIENIDNNPSQKAILQTVMEFLFLENNDHTYTEEYEDVLSYFSVNKRGIQVIQDAISNIYHATGEQGLSEKYGFSAGNLSADAGDKVYELISKLRLNKLYPVEDDFKYWFEIEYCYSSDCSNQLKNDLQNRLPQFMLENNPIHTISLRYIENLNLIRETFTNRFSLDTKCFEIPIKNFEGTSISLKNQMNYFNADLGTAGDSPQKLTKLDLTGRKTKTTTSYVINKFQRTKAIHNLITAMSVSIDALFIAYENAIGEMLIIINALELQTDYQAMQLDIQDIEDAEELYNMGVAYFQGIGIDKSEEKALNWLCKSYSKGNENARKFIEKNFLDGGIAFGALKDCILFIQEPFHGFRKITEFYLLRNNGNKIYVGKHENQSMNFEVKSEFPKYLPNGFVFWLRDVEYQYIIMIFTDKPTYRVIDSWPRSDDSMFSKTFLNLQGDWVYYGERSDFLQKTIINRKVQLDGSNKQNV